MLSAFVTAVRTLTIVPVPGKDADMFAHSLPYFPVIGLFLGAGVYGAGILLPFDTAAVSAVGIIVLLALQTWITGAIHIDGLADAADGFGGGKTKEKTLEIFRDSSLGSYGVLAVVFDILLKASCWYFLFSNAKGIIAALSIIAGRSAQAFFAALLPNARTDSIAIPFGKPGVSVLAALCAIVVLVIALTIYGLGIVEASLYWSIGLAIAAVFGAYCMKRLNGITGDCIGAVNELVEIAILLAALLRPHA
jgi:adenosylcobinamide-GDP ribazoletransferase